MDLHAQKRFGINSVSLVIARGAEMGFAMISGILIVRYLGAENFGKYAFVVAMVSFAGCFADIGLDNIIIRESARGRADASFAAGLFVRAIATIVTLTFLSLILILFDFSPELRHATFVAFIPLVIIRQLGLNVFRAIALGKERAYLDMYLTVPFQLVRFVAVLWVIRHNLSFTAFFIAFLVTDSLQGIAALIFTQAALAKIRFTGIVRDAKYMLRETAPLTFVMILNTSSLYVGTFVLKGFKSDLQVGLFGAPFKFINAACVMILAFLAAALPVLARMQRESGRKTDKRVKHFAWLVTMALAPFSLLATVLAAPAVHLLMGADYNGSIAAFQILSWLLVIRALGYFYSLALVSEGLQKSVLVSSLVFFLTNALLSIILIPLYAQTGAAVAALAAEIAYLGMLWFSWAQRTTRYEQLIGGNVIAPNLTEEQRGL